MRNLDSDGGNVYGSRTRLYGAVAPIYDGDIDLVGIPLSRFPRSGKVRSVREKRGDQALKRTRRSPVRRSPKQMLAAKINEHNRKAGRI